MEERIFERIILMQMHENIPSTILTSINL